MTGATSSPNAHGPDYNEICDIIFREKNYNSINVRGRNSS